MPIDTRAHNHTTLTSLNPKPFFVKEKAKRLSRHSFTGLPRYLNFSLFRFAPPRQSRAMVPKDTVLIYFVTMANRSLAPGFITCDCAVDIVTTDNSMYRVRAAVMLPISPIEPAKL